MDVIDVCVLMRAVWLTQCPQGAGKDRGILGARANPCTAEGFCADVITGAAAGVRVWYDAGIVIGLALLQAWVLVLLQVYSFGFRLISMSSIDW